MVWVSQTPSPSPVPPSLVPPTRRELSRSVESWQEIWISRGALTTTGVRSTTSASAANGPPFEAAVAKVCSNTAAGMISTLCTGWSPG